MEFISRNKSDMESDSKCAICSQQFNYATNSYNMCERCWESSNKNCVDRPVRIGNDITVLKEMIEQLLLE